jgi:hypothetical protein
MLLTCRLTCSNVLKIDLEILNFLKIFLYEDSKKYSAYTAIIIC